MCIRLQGGQKKENRWEEQKNMLETAACVCPILQTLEVNQQIIVKQFHKHTFNVHCQCRSKPRTAVVCELFCQSQNLNSSINPTPHLYTGHIINSIILITGMSINRSTIDAEILFDQVGQKMGKGKL